MKDYLSEIDERFPIRNSAEQKASFRDYAHQVVKNAAVLAETQVLVHAPRRGGLLRLGGNAFLQRIPGSARRALP